MGINLSSPRPDLGLHWAVVKVVVDQLLGLNWRYANLLVEFGVKKLCLCIMR